MDGALSRLEDALTVAVTSAVAAPRDGGLGVDVVSVDRIRQIRSRTSSRFESLAFTPHEIAYCRSKQYPDIHFAGHLAAKEAVYKALGLNWDMAFSWRFLEVHHSPAGIPSIVIDSDRLGVRIDASVSVSIAHTSEYAVAVAKAGSPEHPRRTTSVHTLSYNSGRRHPH